MDEFVAEMLEEYDLFIREKLSKEDATHAK